MSLVERKIELVNRFEVVKLAASGETLPIFKVANNSFLRSISISNNTVGSIFYLKGVVVADNPGASQLLTVIPSMNGWLRRTVNNIDSISWNGNIPLSDDYEVTITFFLIEASGATPSALVSWNAERFLA